MIESPSDYEELLSRLREIRKRPDLKLKACSILNEKVALPDGRVIDFVLRPYQTQMVLHLLLMPRFMVGDDTGLGKCCPLDTPIHTNLGIIPLREACAAPPSDLLVPDTFYPATRLDVWNGSRWSAVRRYYFGGVKPTRKIRTSRGYVAEGTLMHPIKVRSEDGMEGWKRMQDLRPGDVLCVCRNAPLLCREVPIPFTKKLKRALRFPPELTPDLARLLGYAVAEGNRNPYGIRITQHPGEAHEDIRTLLWQIFGWRGNEGNKQRDVSILMSSKDAAAYLRACGIEDVLSADKVVPHTILRADPECIGEFLRGYYEGEGSVCEGVLEVSSASEKLLQQVQLLLLSFGIVSSRRPKWSKKYERDYWRLTITGDDLRLFAARIGFVSEKKSALLQEAATRRSNPNLDVIPHAKRLVEDLRAAIQEHGGQISKQWGSAFINTLQHVRTGRRNPTFAFLGRMIVAAEEVGVPMGDPRRHAVEHIFRQQCYYDTIESIEERQAEVADLEVDDPSHCFVGNGFINHNTVETIAALGYKWEADAGLKVLIVTTKSAVTQWCDEIHLFMKGISVWKMTGTPRQRERAREAFLACKTPAVLVCGYRTLVQDFTAVQDWKGMALVFDEATAFKNPQTRIHQIAKFLAQSAQSVWALTATLIKNNLTEGYGIYSVVVPELFPRALSAFIAAYCITVSVPVKRGRRVDKVVGHSDSHVRRFREVIEPFYLGRAKADVAPDLPILTPRQLMVPMSAQEWRAYKTLVFGILLGLPDPNAPETQKKITKMEALLRCQQLVNHVGLIVGQEQAGNLESSKLEALIDLLTEGDLAEQRVIVYSRFRGFLVDYVEPRLREAGVEVVRVTGSENEEERRTAQREFRAGRARVILLTSAGSEALNLQEAQAMVLVDTPWSAGEYLQLVGRMVRIGSPNDRCLAIHLAAQAPEEAVGKRGKRPETIDEYTIRVMSKKLKLIEDVLGQRLRASPGAEDPSLPDLNTSEMAEILDAVLGGVQEMREAEDGV